MNRWQETWLLSMVLACLTGLGLPVSAQQEDAGLRHNPFQRPETVKQTSSAGEGAVDQENLEKPPEFVLSATLVSDMRPLVDIEGEIIGIGEEFKGYRLLTVDEGAAVFSRGDKRYTLNIRTKDLGRNND